MSFKLLEKSEKYQSVFHNIITDDEELLQRIFVILEKFICNIYGVRDTSNANDVRLHLFSETYQSKNLDINLKKKSKF